MLRIVVAVGLWLWGQHFNRGEFKGVGWWWFSWRGKRQLMVVMMGVMVMMMVTQARLHVSRELHLGHREGHLMCAEGCAGWHVIAPELKHSRCWADGALIGELRTLWAHCAPHLPGLAAGGGQKGEGVGCPLWRRAGRPVLCNNIQKHIRFPVLLDDLQGQQKFKLIKKKKALNFFFNHANLKLNFEVKKKSLHQKNICKLF